MQKNEEKKRNFQRLRAALKSYGTAKSEAVASADPMKALKDKSYLNIKGKKGVAV